MLKLRVLVVYPYTLFREGICAILEKEHNFEVREAKGDWFEILDSAKKVMPQIIILPLEIPPRIRSMFFSLLMEEILGTNILLLAPSGKEDEIASALNEGAHGYLPIQATGEDLIKVIKAITRKEFWSKRSITKTNLIITHLRNTHFAKESKMKQQEVNGFHILSKRDREIAMLLSQGLSEKEIASRLTLSANTVHKHIKHTYKYLGVTTKGQAIAHLLQSG